MAVLPPLQNGQNIDADREMAWIKNGNYGNALKPMAIDGADVDNSIDLGSNSFRWRKLNAGGVVAGTPVGSFTVTERRWARYPLPAKDLSAWVDGEKVFWTIDITSLGKITGAACFLTFVGDDFNFSTGSGTIVTNAQERTSRSDNYGYAATFYRTFETRVTNTTVEIVGLAFFGGFWDYYYNYFVANTANWDGTAQTRGWLDIEYTPI